MTDTLAYFPEMKIDDGKMFEGADTNLICSKLNDFPVRMYSAIGDRPNVFKNVSVIYEIRNKL